MTLEEYKIQDALGSLSERAKEAVARDLTTPTDLLQHIASLDPISGAGEWFLRWLANCNLSMRPLQTELRVEEKDTTI